MSKVLFTISYSVRPEMREKYLEFAAELKTHFVTQNKRDYSVFEVKGKKNTFTEVFSFSNMSDFDALEEQQDEKTQELEGRLEQFIDKGGMKYSTLVEVG